MRPTEFTFYGVVRGGQIFSMVRSETREKQLLATEVRV